MSHGSISTAPACGNARPPVSIESPPHATDGCRTRGTPYSRTPWRHEGGHALRVGLERATESGGGRDGRLLADATPSLQPTAFSATGAIITPGRKCVTQARGPEERRQAVHVTGALPRASSAGAGGACAREMGRTDRAPADMQWEAQFPSSQTSTAELCYLDGVLVRLRETRTHHLQEVPCRLRIHPPHAPSLPQRACARLTGTSRRLIAQRWACATRVARGWCSSAAQRGRLRCI